MNDYTVQIVEHVNHVAFVEANSQEEAEQLVVANVNKYDWTQMDGGNACEVIVENDDSYEDTEHLKDQT